ncbi:helix-turn-helix transcriptional regulator [Streptomyces sp. NPDC048564]|uniref:helix-turn-helix domain-containing protein n=1 Tax=Streptomyces sp. NPDC048564 TaxID=3155760 RepID=UPI00343A2C3E
MNRILRRSESNMGRREQPISPCSRSLQALAAWLRSGREEAGLTYEQLAARTPFSPDTLSRAASGSSVPRNVRVVVAYAGACGLPEAEAERLWKLARRDEARAAGVLNGQRGGLHISMVKDFADLHSAIVELYQSAGSPALRSLDDRMGGHGQLPHSTVSRVLKGRSRPNRQFVLAFAEAVNVRRSEVAEWGKAWDRADRDRRSTRSRRARVQGDVEDRLTKHDRVTPRDLQLLMSDLEALAGREPGIKLLVIPEAEYSQTYRSGSRMTRELLVDQAQRQGDLSCPRCNRPSFGYDGSQGWRAELCTDCTTPTTPATADPSGPEPREILALPSERPRLPRRMPGQSWPPPGLPVHFGTLDADVFEATGPPPEVCCRLCRGFHEAVAGCQSATGSGEAAAAGHGRTAPVNGPAAAGQGSEKEAVGEMGDHLDAFPGAAGGADHGSGPAGVWIPSVTVRATIGIGAQGLMLAASGGQRELTATAPASQRPP